MRSSSELDGNDFSEELEAETGFSSYEAYLRASGSKHGSDMGALDSIGYLRENSRPHRPSHCCIVDVPKDHSARGLAVRLNLSSGPELGDYESSVQDIRGSERVTAIELLKGLRSPVDQGSVRVVAWYIQAPNLISEWVDVIGAWLQVPSSFFTALLHNFGSLAKLSNPIKLANRLAYPQHLVIGNAVATLRHNNGSDVPTILIAYTRDSNIHLRGLKTNTLLRLDAERKLPFALPNGNGFWESTKFCEEFSAHYQRLLRANLEQDASSILSDQDLFLLSLLPLFKMASMSVQSMHGAVEQSLSKLYNENRKPDEAVRDERSNRSRNATYKRLDQERYQLRRAVEEFENDQQFFVDYVVSSCNEDWLDKRSYRTTAAYSELTTKVAKRLEAEVRDYMQLVVGVLSIEESRKSIQLSNTQLDEGKKIKIFTILAFVYVPLNLATSIFGMNLQQLNAEGQPVWVFILTAILATMLTAFIWFCIDQINSIRRWIRLRGTIASIFDDFSEGSPNYSIGVRLTMICCIMRWGHTKWMFRSIVWFHLLTNSERIGWEQGVGSWLPVGHYVTRYFRLRDRAQWDFEKLK